MIIDEVYLQYVHMIIFIVVKMGTKNNNNLYYISKIFYDTHTEEVIDNKTWTASGNPGGLQTHAFCHN